MLDILYFTTFCNEYTMCILARIFIGNRFDINNFELPTQTSKFTYTYYKV